MKHFVLPRHARRARRATALAIAGLLLTTGTTLAASPGSGKAMDLAIVSEARLLDAAEIAAADVTKTSRGKAALAAERKAQDSIDVDSRPFRVFKFGKQQVIVEAASPLRVVTGLNAAGERVFDVAPLATPAAVSTRAGYLVPPSSAFKYNVDGGGTETVGTWKRTWFWTITIANNYKPTTTSTAYDYIRIHGKMLAATLTGSSSNEGFRRAWLEFDRNNSGWTTASEFELPQPADSYGGNGTSTVTIGFKSGLTYNLGVPPVTAGGSFDLTYSGSMTKSTENWHPVVRSEVGSGGVQWCRYESAEFTGSRTVATMVSARTAYNGSNQGGWFILKGMQESYGSCPSQI